MSSPTRRPLIVTVSPKYSFVTTQSEASTSVGGRSAKEACQRGSRAGPGDHGHALARSVPGADVVLPVPPPVHGAPEHPDPVLELRKSLVGLRARDLCAREHVHLVRGEHDSRLVTLQVLALEPAHLLQRGDRVLSGVRAKLRQAPAVLRQTHRHDRDRLHLRMPRRQILDRLREHRAVIDARADHELRVHLDPRLGEPVDLLQDQTRLRILHEPHAHVGIGCVHRDVEGREPLVEDPLEVGVGEVREGDEVPVHEREDVVVILDEELAAHALRVLVDEAEDAVVVAALRLPRLELRPERDAVLADALDHPLHAVHAADQDLQLLLGDLRPEVDLVMELHAVDLEEALAGNEAEPLGESAGLDLGNREGIAEANHVASSLRLTSGVRRPAGGRTEGVAF
jgi:hypothetical protein